MQSTGDPADGLRIEYLPLGQVKRYDKNPKKHDVGALVQSIRRYGFRDAPIFDATLGALVAGHGRLKALDEMRRSGDPVPAGVRENGTDWLVPVQLGVDAKSAAEARAFLLDHNALTVAGGDMGVEGILRLYDQSALGDMLKELAEEQALPVTLDGDDLDDLLGVEKPAVDAEPQIDRADELREKWGVKTGQLWRLGDHRLLCGDSTSAEDVGRLLAGEVPFLMVTDPPYGVEYDPEWRQEAAEKGYIGFSPAALGKVTNDDRVDWTAAWALFPGDVAYVWHAGVFGAEVAAGLAEAKFELRSQVIWTKPSFAISRGHYNWQHEPCWYAVRKGKSAKFIGSKSETTVWPIGRAKSNAHGTQKPVECMARPMGNHDASLVYEPFAGSGTTIIAAENLGRRCFALEIEPKYVAVCIQRWADATGKVPELVDG